MKAGTVIGYKDLFSDLEENFDDLIRDLSPGIVARLCGAFNNELNGEGGLHAAQKVILHDICYRFSQAQKADLRQRISSFLVKIGNEKSAVLFAPRYFIDMILKDLNSDRLDTNSADIPEHEYNFLKAYLQIADEIALIDKQTLDFSKLSIKEPYHLLKLIWLSGLSQFEYNEKSEQLFETYKTICFFKYLIQSEYRPYFKEYLDQLHLRNPAQYLKSFEQLIRTKHCYDPNARILKRLNFTAPNSSVDQTHLKRLSVNLQAKKGKYILSDIKKEPLWFAQDRQGYLVLDYNFLTKKMFRGAFFELVHETSLTQNLGYSKKERETVYNTYSSKVATAFEDHYFRPVMELFTKKTSDLVHFDDGTANVPDCYIRIGNVIFLFEFKAYVFPEKHIVKPNFDKFVQYLEERFVDSDAKKQKGVGQLVTQIEYITGDKFKFDEGVCDRFKENGVIIYPVLVHSDFNFTMPGINAYLAGKLVEKLVQLKPANLLIAPLVMINLETILDLAITGKNIFDLESGFRKYFDYLHESDMAFVQQPTQDGLLAANLSFDIFYQQQLIAKSEPPVKEYLHQLLELSGINLEEFNLSL